jgi:hypothetical protein
MRKGFFTQCLCVLLERTVSIEQIERALQQFSPIAPEASNEHWAFSGPCVLLPYRPAVNGYAIVDVVPVKWPDHMGNVEQEKELFSAWMMGFWGPGTYPGALGRALQHQERVWDGVASVVNKHSALIRVRLSYAVGADDDSTLRPADYDPIAEMAFLMKVAMAVLQMDGALCYFNPNAETLRNLEGVRESMDHWAGNDLPPMDLLSDVRLFKAEGDWSLMDSVGNGQLEIPDQEACFSEAYDPNEVAAWLRDLALYMIRNGAIIKAGDSTDGPAGKVWRAKVIGESLTEPPRQVIRWFPDDGTLAPAALQAGGT